MPELVPPTGIKKGPQRQMLDGIPQTCRYKNDSVGPTHMEWKRAHILTCMQGVLGLTKIAMAAQAYISLTQAGQRCTGVLASAVWYLLGAARLSLGGSGSDADWARLPLDPLLLQLPPPAPMCAMPHQQRTSTAGLQHLTHTELRKYMEGLNLKSWPLHDQMQGTTVW